MHKVMKLNENKTVVAQEIMRVGRGVYARVGDEAFMWFDAGDFDRAPEPNTVEAIADSPALRVPAPISSEFALDTAVQKLNENPMAQTFSKILGEANGESKEAVSAVEGESQDSGAGTEHPLSE
jgi:hypothetical protein